MGKALFIGQTLNECQVALVENGEIVEFLMDRAPEKSRDQVKVGNLYRGKVLRVLPGMQSAFVDIGHEKAAFLHVDDAYLPTLEEQRSAMERAKLACEQAPSLRGEVINDELSTFPEGLHEKFRPKSMSIEKFLKEGQEILVQVAKEPISKKGPRVTRHITLAGRYIVYMPLIEHVGVSRRIDQEHERERLKEVLSSICPEGRGVIARTIADGQSYKTLKSDFQMLVKIWKEIDKKEKRVRAPGLVHKDLTFIQRVLRDITDEDVGEIIVDAPENLKEVEKFVAKFIPPLKNRAKFFDESQEGITLFEKYGLAMEIERGLSNRVYLRSGGSLNIDQTEALVSIDVNTGRYVGRKNLEETILRTNLEAVKEIAYQLRLRNCGGIIIIDFIDMEKQENRDFIYKALLEALKKDRSKTNVMPISGLGIVEMTRKRTRDTLARILCGACSYCEGSGRVKSPLTVCYEMIRKASKTFHRLRGKEIFIYVHPEVAAILANSGHNMIEALEEKHGLSLNLRAENSYHVEQYEIFPQDGG